MEEKLIFKATVGSRSYGTNIKGSDIDYKGVYMQNVDDLLTFNYKEQINVTADETYWEVQRFLQLLQSANPSVLELLYSPKDCIIKTSPAFDLIIKHRDKFLTKQCLKSFGGYAIAQIKKARGLDKKQNWEKDRVTRKTILDFVYVYVDGKTMPWKKYEKISEIKQENCGLTNLSNFPNCYALYYANGINEASYKGLVRKKSNQLRLSSIPKELNPICLINYNKDGYTTHCKDYNEYQKWLKNRNTQRYVDVKNHGQKIDGKNMLHCRRLIDQAIEIAKGGKLNVRRPNADYLISIRKGEVDLTTLLDEAERDVKALDDLFAKSDLPDNIDKKFVNNLLLEIRHLE